MKRPRYLSSFLQIKSFIGFCCTNFLDYEKRLHNFNKTDGHVTFQNYLLSVTTVLRKFYNERLSFSKCKSCLIFLIFVFDNKWIYFQPTIFKAVASPYYCCETLSAVCHIQFISNFIGWGYGLVDFIAIVFFNRNRISGLFVPKETNNSLGRVINVILFTK